MLTLCLWIFGRIVLFRFIGWPNHLMKPSLHLTNLIQSGLILNETFVHKLFNFPRDSCQLCVSKQEYDIKLLDKKIQRRRKWGLSRKALAILKPLVKIAKYSRLPGENNWNFTRTSHHLLSGQYNYANISSILTVYIRIVYTSGYVRMFNQL